MKDNYLSRAKAVFFLLMLLFTVFLEAKANPVDVERARQVAMTFLGNNNVQTRGLREVSNEVGLSNVYVFTTENSFVLIAADDRVQPILGYSETGGFVIEEMPDNVRWWLQGYNDQVQFVVENYLTPTQEVTRQWQELASGTVNANRSRTVVGPLITTKWSQGSPYNSLCPSNSVTGCVATAMAQIMKYWNYPTHGIGWHSYTPYSHPEYGEQTANFNATNYEWNNMVTYYNYYYDNQGSIHWDSNQTDTQIQAVATLMYHCGVAVDIDYNTSGSSASNYITSALSQYFNYNSSTYLYRDNYSDSDWITMIRNEMNASRPVFYSGSGSSGGHAFVCDGYDSGTYGNYYFHFNWGWAGRYDGYFSIDNMTFDGNNYSYSQTATIGIQPSGNNANPANLTYTQNGRNVTLHWSSVSGAASYNVYCDGNYLGNATSTTFTFVAPYGSHIYYVRSVDATGALSLSSNTVTVTVAYQTPVVDDLAASVSGNDVALSWTAPDWCYPETPTATLNYGNGTPNYSWTSIYYAHRHLAANLAQYANKAVYKVSTYVKYPGDYTVYIYTNSNGNQPMASSLAATQSRHTSSSGVWIDFSFDAPVVISGSSDLWVVMKQENTGQQYPTPSFDLPSHNINAFYAGSSPTSLYDANSGYNCAWFINTYLTDGSYTYNIYRNGSNIASNVSNTSYNDNNLSNGVYTYYVKTNFYAGESAASNSVTAQVNPTWYTIATSCDPNNGGTATGGGTYYNGQSCTLTATPAAGYTFVNWTKNGTQVSTNPSYTFTVAESTTYVAHFQFQTYNVTTTADPTAGGLVSGGGSYNHGQSCTVHASANAGYNFVNWTENGMQVSTNANYTFTVTGNRTLVAHFQTQGYTIAVTADPTAGGTISGSGTFTYGQTCTLTATATQGYTFVNWTKNGTQVSTNPTYTFTVTESATYVAHFQAQSYTVSVSANPTAGGSVSGGGTYNHGQSCTVHATANAGYTFVNWTENGTQVSTNANYTFTVTGNRTLVAHFQTQGYTIAATADPTAGGTITGAGTFSYGQTCTLRATANQGYTFVNWTKNGTQVSTNPTYTFTVTESATYVAHFQAQSYTVSVSANPTTGGAVRGGGTYTYGQSCTVQATANTGYTFVNWTENGTQVSTNANYTFTVTGSRSLVAHFSTQNYIITATADPIEGGTISGSGGYDYGDQCTLTTSPNQGYNFVNWTKNGTQVSTNLSFTFTVTESATYIAHFQAQSYTVSVSADPTEGGVVSGDGTYLYGQSCTVQATANLGYDFVNWTENEMQVSTNADYTFTVMGNCALVAHFQAQSYTIEATADPTEGGIISGAGTFAYGQSCTLTATANQGYDFVNWTKNGTPVSTDLSYTFTVTESATYVAQFLSQSYTISVSADPMEGGMVIGGGTYTYGQTCTLNVDPYENYSFVNWTENDTVVSEEPSFCFIVEGSRAFVAHLSYYDAAGENYDIAIDIYPNPVKNMLTVMTSQPVNKWEIFSASGAILYCIEENADRMEFYVSHLAPGTYMIRMTTNKAVLTRRFVKQ